MRSPSPPYPYQKHGQSRFLTERLGRLNSVISFPRHHCPIVPDLGCKVKKYFMTRVEITLDILVKSGYNGLMKTLIVEDKKLDVSHLSNGDVNALVLSLSKVNATVAVRGEDRYSALEWRTDTQRHVKCYTKSHPASNYANAKYHLYELKKVPTDFLSFATNKKPAAAELMHEGIKFTAYAHKLVTKGTYVIETPHGKLPVPNEAIYNYLMEHLPTEQASDTPPWEI